MNLSSNTDKKDPLSYISSLIKLPLYFTPTNQFEILKTINNLKITSPGYEDIHPKIIKQISTFIALSSNHIIGSSLATVIVPLKFQIAKVIPIIKNGQGDDMCFY